ncbi:MAG: hypothetical protein ABIL58_06400 [Pseudomonadota bacterium]
MIDAFDVPEAYQAAFRRLRRRMSADQQANPAVMETALIYLKLGGEKLAAHRIALYKKQFETECNIFRRRLVDDVIDEDEEDGDGDGENRTGASTDEDTD